jgi:aromatic ring-opening dioxygenase LigB subunit
MDLKVYLVLAGSLGLAYLSYSYLNKPKSITMDKELTKRICQEIKHQMMIVCITYSKAMKKIR